MSFGMKRGFLTALTIGVFSLGTSANATTYNVNRTVGAGAVTGFVETDGTLGILGSGNIVDWELTLTAPNLLNGPSLTISKAIEVKTLLSGTATTATATQLLFNFSTSGSFFLLQGGMFSNFWCLESANAFCTVEGQGEHIGPSSSFGNVAQTTVLLGQVAFAEVSQTPLPAALPLFVSGLAALGLVARRRKRKELAA